MCGPHRDLGLARKRLWVAPIETLALTQRLCRETLALVLWTGEPPFGRDGGLCVDVVAAPGPHEQLLLPGPAGGPHDGVPANVRVGHQVPGSHISAAGGPVHAQREHGEDVALMGGWPVGVVADRYQPAFDHRSPPGVERAPPGAGLRWFSAAGQPIGERAATRAFDGTGRYAGAVGGGRLDVDPALGSGALGAGSLVRRHRRERPCGRLPTCGRAGPYRRAVSATRRGRPGPR